MSDGVVDLSEAPRHSGFGDPTNADEESAGSLTDSAESAWDNRPIVSNVNSIKENLPEISDRFEKLFDGEATLDDAMAQVQSVLALQTDINLIVDAYWAMGMSSAQSSPPIALAASSLAAAGLDFLVSYFQPLQDAIGVFTGNSERIADSGRMWSETAKALAAVGEEVGSIMLGQLDPAWEGEACAGAGKRLGEFQDVLQVCSDLSTGIATLMNLTADFADRLYNRARQMMIDTVNNVVALAEALKSPNPLTVLDAIVAVCLQIQRAVLQVAQMAIQAARIYLQAGQLMVEINGLFEETVGFLDWAVADPLPSGGCDTDIRV